MERFMKELIFHDVFFTFNNSTLYDTSHIKFPGNRLKGRRSTCRV